MILIVFIPLLCFILWQLHQDYYAFNIPLFHFMNGIPPHSDWLWQNITFMGDGLPIFVLLVFFCRKHAHLLWLGILAALITGLGVQVLKYMADLARPAAYLGVEHIEVIGKALKKHSFPSGHAATAFVMAGVLSHYVKQLAIPYPRLLALLFVLLASIIAWSRVVVGVHWPMDVMVGAVWGWYSTTLILMVSARTAWIGHTRTSANILYGLAGITAGILWSFNGGYPMAAALAKSISLCALLFLGIVLYEQNYRVKLTIILQRWRIRLQLQPSQLRAKQLLEQPKPE